MQGTDQRAYDRGSTIFSPDGRLYQVEYAREAVSRGSPTVGVRTAGGVVLAASRRIGSRLLEPTSVEKLHKVDAHVGVASAGHVADGRRLVDFARRRAQRERLHYDQPIGVEALTKAIADHVQESTQVGGSRPFGAALLVAGVDDAPRLFETDPSGAPTEWKATAVGANHGAIRDHLETNYGADPSLSDGIDLALEALAEPADDGFAPPEVGVGVVEDDGYRTLPPDERRASLASLGLLREAS